MNDKLLHLKLGIGSLIAALFLFLVAIPVWVSSPSNVPFLVLAPTFWPNTLAILTGLTGVGLLWSSWRKPKSREPIWSDIDNRPAAYFRLAILAVIMAATLVAMPRLGLVWTAMLDFALMALLVRTSHPKIALASAVIVPLALYLFFAHVAGVAIPQGIFVRLP